MDKNTPVISIVIPVYNAAPYLSKCISSVCSQSFKNWEVLAVDDGSTDDSLKILQEWFKKDRRIKNYHRPNGGVVAAREFAVTKAMGKYLFFLDSDDYLPNDALEILLRTMETANADLCIGSYTLVWEKTGKNVFVNHRKSFRNVIGCLEYCLRNGEMFLPIKLYKTDLYKKSVHIPKGIIVQEDTIGVTQYLEQSSTVVFTTQNVYYYLKHEGTATSTYSLAHIKSLLVVVDFLLGSRFCKTTTWCIHFYCARLLQYCLSSSLNNNDTKQYAICLLKHLSWKARIMARISLCLRRLVASVKKFLKH